MNDVLLLTGRVVFAAFFIMSGYNHLTKLGWMARYAGSMGVPAPKVAVGVTGLMLLAGGLSFLLGYEVRWGAIVLVAFLVPTAFIMHRFWGVADAAQAQNQFINFWKNLVAAGGALIIYWHATVNPVPWPFSLGS